MKARAERLARGIRISDAARTADGLEVVVFRLAREFYGIELSRIRIIEPLKTVTYIPGLPDFIVGIINYRGEIISVIDLKLFFDLPGRESADKGHVIILSKTDMEFGIIADEIVGVRSIPRNTLQPSLPTLTGVRSAYLKGVTAEGLVIIDGGKILSDPKMRIDQDAYE